MGSQLATTTTAGTLATTGITENPVSVNKLFVRGKGSGAISATEAEKVLKAINPRYRPSTALSTMVGCSTGVGTTSKGLTLTGNTAGLASLKTTGLLEEDLDESEPAATEVEIYSSSTDIDQFGTHYMVFSFKDYALKQYCLVLITLLAGVSENELEDLVEITLLPDKRTLQFESAMPAACFSKKKITEVAYGFFEKKKPSASTLQTVANLLQSFDTEVSRIRKKLCLKQDQAVSGKMEISLPFQCEKIKDRIHSTCPNTKASILYVLLTKKEVQTEESKPRIKRLGTSTSSERKRPLYEELLTVQKEQNVKYMYEYKVSESPGNKTTSTGDDEDSTNAE